MSHFIIIKAGELQDQLYQQFLVCVDSLIPNRPNAKTVNLDTVQNITLCESNQIKTWHMPRAANTPLFTRPGWSLMVTIAGAGWCVQLACMEVLR